MCHNTYGYYAYYQWQTNKLEANWDMSHMDSLRENQYISIEILKASLMHGIVMYAIKDNFVSENLIIFDLICLSNMTSVDHIMSFRGMS